MEKLLIVNAFSINMLPNRRSQEVLFNSIDVQDAKELVKSKTIESAIGHEDLAAIVSGMLGVSIPPNRVSVTLDAGDTILVAQYRGQRLPEGTTTLPEGASLEFWLVEIA